MMFSSIIWAAVEVEYLLTMVANAAAPIAS
jgi:hypothetical protein